MTSFNSIEKLNKEGSTDDTHTTNSGEVITKQSNGSLKRTRAGDDILNQIYVKNEETFNNLPSKSVDTLYFIGSE